MIKPAEIAFDIDGVFADLMTLFLDLACNKYGMNKISYEDVTSYNLEDCLDLDPKLIKKIFKTIHQGSYNENLEPVPDAPEVIRRLTEIGDKTVLFVTARPHLGHIHEWILKILSVEPSSIEAVATGSFDNKAHVLLERNISYFVEDRLETCFSLKKTGINPILFKQPWNRQRHPFMEVGSWKQLEAVIDFDDQGMAWPQ